MLNVPAAVRLLVPTSGGEGEGFSAPTIEEFFPPQLFGEGTWWGPTRIDLTGFFMAGVLSLFFVLQALLYTACLLKLAEIRRQWQAAHPGSTRPRDLWSPFRPALADGFRQLCAAGLV